MGCVGEVGRVSIPAIENDVDESHVVEKSTGKAALLPEFLHESESGDKFAESNLDCDFEDRCLSGKKVCKKCEEVCKVVSVVVCKCVSVKFCVEKSEKSVEYDKFVKIGGVKKDRFLKVVKL